MENKIFPIESYKNMGVIFRDSDSKSGQLYLDLQALKECFLIDYEEFLVNSEEFIDSLKKQLSVFSIDEIQIKNFDVINPISELRVEHINKLVNVRGMITKTTKVIALIKEQSFECSICGVITKCGGDQILGKCSCGRKGNFKLINQALEDMQEIEIEEPQDELEGRQPRKIRVRLLRELTDKDFSGILQPGNKVSILGYVKKIEVIKPKKEETIFEYRVDALEVTPLDEQFSKDIINEEDLKSIMEISADNPLKKLSDSLAPSIFGNDDIKKALVLQMVGGVKRDKPGGLKSRDRIHVLLCGDPGTGKSQLAKNINLRMPKSYYISGDETSKAGLACIVDRDELLKEWCLKVGALSKANDSILIIDEMDKLEEDDRNALHTPMENGQIMINKADIHTTLNTNCSILGVANPKDGMFDLGGDKTITNQIDLPPPLMSRFDVIFVMTDTINKESDNSISKLIYNGKQNNEEEISISLFRKYICYARKLNPKLLEENLEKLSEFYHNVRKQSISSDSKMRGMPITPRHFEGLLRLAEASAKVRLSKTVDKEDIEIAQQIFYQSLLKLGIDKGTGLFDFARLGAGKTLSRKNRMREVLNILEQICTENNMNNVGNDFLKEKCLEKGISKIDFEESISDLNKECLILQEGNRWVLNN